MLSRQRSLPQANSAREAPWADVIFMAISFLATSIICDPIFARKCNNVLRSCREGRSNDRGSRVHERLDLHGAQHIF